MGPGISFPVEEVSEYIRNRECHKDQGGRIKTCYKNKEQNSTYKHVEHYLVYILDHRLPCLKPVHHINTGHQNH